MAVALQRPRPISTPSALVAVARMPDPNDEAGTCDDQSTPVAEAIADLPRDEYRHEGGNTRNVEHILDLTVVEPEVLGHGRYEEGESGDDEN